MDWAKIPSLSALRAFEAAARHQNLSAAARELNVTHAAIAQHVRALEADFDESLLVRQGRGVALTEPGRQFADALAEGFHTISEGVSALRLRGVERPLNITVTPAFAANWLMPRIGDFWTKHPDIKLNINPSTTLVDLKRDGFDLAVRYGTGDWPGLETQVLTDADYWGVVHPDLVAGRTITSLRDLQDLPWLLDAHVMERKVILEREGVDFAALNLTILNTNDLVLSAAVAGLGVTFQPRSIIEREIASGQLIKVIELKEKDLGYHLVTPPDRMSANLRIFMSWLRKKARDA